MRRVYILALVMLVSVGVLGYLGLWSKKTNMEFPKEDEVKSNITTEGKNIVDLEYSDSIIRIAWFETRDPTQISLFSNLDEKKTAKLLMQEKGCKNIVSGGFYTKLKRNSDFFYTKLKRNSDFFYTKEGEHIGLFVMEGEVLKRWAKNALFDGVFGVDDKGVVSVSEGMPQSDFRFAVQAGPILIKDNNVQTLKLKSDEGARRIIVAIEEEGKVVFLVLFDPNSLFIGPNLSDLPSVLAMFEEKSGIKFKDALNLDGGTASAFYSEDISLAELSPIGSFFCIR